MIAGFWRNAHFLLAITISLFLILASISGALLGIEAAMNRTAPQAVSLEEITLGEAKEKIEAQFSEVYEIEITPKGYVIVNGANNERYSSFYVNPKDGLILGEVKPPSPFFQFIRSFHRSLYLKETGRFLVSFVSFLTVLLVLSGLFLLRKRMGGFTKLYAHIKEENQHRKNHIILGRWFWLVILLVSISGAYLGLNRFGMFPSYKIKKERFVDEKILVDLDAIALKRLEKLVYPFGKGPSEEFELLLNDRFLKFQQGNLSLTEQSVKPWAQLLQKWSYTLHTGEGNMLLALILTLTACVVLYFVFSGLKIASKTSWTLLRFRIEKQKKPISILYGSETGNTYGFAKQLKKRLKKEGIIADLSSMNRFYIDENIQTIIVLTATYGEGEAPANATLFNSKFNLKEPQKIINYAVVGFGSRSYPKFCQFAVDIDTLLDNHPKYKQLMPLFKINNQEEKAYSQWETLLLNLLNTNGQG